MREQAGYTLLELLVVLAVMALIIAAIPGIAMPGVYAIRFRGGVQAVAFELENAHEIALTTGRTIILDSSDLEGQNGFVTRTFPARLLFFPDGSATQAEVTVAYRGRRDALRVDPITGRVSVDE